MSETNKKSALIATATKDKERSKLTYPKHKYAVTGYCVTPKKPKRKHSSDLELENKRERTRSPKKTISMTMTSEEEQEKFTRMMIKDLQDERVTELLIKRLETRVDQKTEEIKNEVRAVTESNMITAKKTAEMEVKLDVFEQRERQNNIIIE